MQRKSDIMFLEYCSTFIVINYDKYYIDKPIVAYSVVDL